MPTREPPLPGPVVSRSFRTTGEADGSLLSVQLRDIANSGVLSMLRVQSAHLDTGFAGLLHAGVFQTLRWAPPGTIVTATANGTDAQDLLDALGTLHVLGLQIDAPDAGEVPA